MTVESNRNASRPEVPDFNLGDGRRGNDLRRGSPLLEEARKMRTRVSLRVLPVAFLALAILTAGPGAGEATMDDSARGWVLRVSPTWIDSSYSGGFVVGYDDGATVSGVDVPDVGLSVAGECRLSPRFGLEVGVLATSSLVGVRTRDGAVVDAGTSTYYTLIVGPDIHLTPDQPADFFFGPFLAYTDRTDVGFHHDTIGGGIGWGAILGIDIPVGERGWRVCPSVRYVETNLDGTDGNGDRFDLDFTAVGVGFGYRW